MAKANVEDIPNATTIINECLNEAFPNVKRFLQKLVKGVKINERKVGKSFQYTQDVEKFRFFTAHALFMNYFIRKHLSNQYNINITDSRTEHILKNRTNYKMRDRLYEDIKKHYEIFKDPKTKALDIVESIKIVAMSHLIFFGTSIPNRDYMVNEDNLREVISYFESLEYNAVDLNPTVSCEYFNGDADLIFDKEVIVEIKTSKHHSLASKKPTINLNKFYLPILYAFGYFKKTGIKIKKFKIYNPLLNDEYSIELRNINFQLFENALETDGEMFSSILELTNQEVDLPFFP